MGDYDPNLHYEGQFLVRFMDLLIVIYFICMKIIFVKKIEKKYNNHSQTKITQV